MTKALKTIKEIITSLISTSNAMQSVRGRVSTIDAVNFLKAQEYLTASIQYLERGKRNLEARTKRIEI